MKKLSFLLLIILLTFVGSASAQMAIGRDPVNQQYIQTAIQNSYAVEEIDVFANVNGQMADLTVKQTLLNPNARSMEVEIFFPLPEQAAIQNFMLMVDDKEFPGKLLPKAEATQIYEGIVRSQRDPALMEYVGYGLFKTSVFPIPAGQKRTITIRYSVLLPKKYDVVTLSYPFGTQKFSSQALKKVKFTARIHDNTGLKNIYSPTDEVQTSKQGDKEALVKMELTNVLPDHDLKLCFSQNAGAVGANVLSYKPGNDEDGYFMLMASPSGDQMKKSVSKKTIVFVIDQSGSMSGTKLDQAKQALKFITERLNEDDLFNIINFESGVNLFKPELQRYNSKTKAEAIQYINSLTAGGGTNILDAVVTGMRQIADDKRPHYLIFMTDGQAGQGEMEIANACQQANRFNTRLFSFGVGEGVNARLLDRLSSGNGGSSEYVSNGAELEQKMSSFYAGIADPILNNISISFEGTDISEMYPRVIPDVFEGSQLVWVGRYRKGGKAKVCIKGGMGGEEKEIILNTELAKDKSDDSYAFVEKMWATKRIGFLMQEIDMHGQNPEIVQSLVALSTRHGILTPYTAYLSREDADFRDITSNTQNTSMELRQKLEGSTSGANANAMRSVNNTMLNANNTYAWSFGDGSANSNITNVANRTFYDNKGMLVESTLSSDEEKNATVVKRYSREYFDLAKANNAEMNKVLGLNKTIIFKEGSNVYRIQ